MQGKSKWCEWEIFAGPENEPLLVQAKFNEKNKVMELKEGNNVELVRDRSLNNLNMVMTLQKWNLKL